MRLFLTRTDYLPTGIIGQLESENGEFICLTLEHAYSEQSPPVVDTTTYRPKLPNGSYKCVRGTHRLEGMNHDFETFEILGVPGHTGILFHVGNYNKDSNGCVLVGSRTNYSNEPPGIYNSKVTFESLMFFLKDVNEFDLEVQ